MIGYTRAMTYNSWTGLLWPSDLKCALFTLCTIVGPSALCYIFPIWKCDDSQSGITLQYKIELTCAYSFSLFLCLIMFFMVTFTEPGILPSVYLNSGIPSAETKQADNMRDYYCGYQRKRELADTLAGT